MAPSSTSPEAGKQATKRKRARPGVAKPELPPHTQWHGYALVGLVTALVAAVAAWLQWPVDADARPADALPTARLSTDSATRQQPRWQGSDFRVVRDDVVHDGRSGLRMRVQVLSVGSSHTKVAVIDNVLTKAELQRLVSSAADAASQPAGQELFEEVFAAESRFRGLNSNLSHLHIDAAGQYSYRGVAEGFPGLRLFLDNPKLDNTWYIHAVANRINRIVQGTFDLSLASFKQAAVSLLCKSPAALHISNRCPHFDLLGDLASTHFLSGRHGGTAFYRLRATGQEVVGPAERESDETTTAFGCPPQPGQDSAEVLGEDKSCPSMPCVDPMGGLLSESNEMWERLLLVPPRVNRLVVYPGAAFHGAHLGAADQAEAACDVRRGRLTLNVFWSADEHVD